MSGRTPWSQIEHKAGDEEREALKGVLAAVSKLDRNGIRRVLWLANDLANGPEVPQ